MMDKIRDWLAALLRREPGLDYLGAEPGSLSVDSVPTSPVVRRYRDGNARLKLDFVISGREFLDGDTDEAEKNMKFFEELARRLETASCWGISRRWTRVTGGAAEVLSTAYPVSVDGHGTARYQMQCRLRYYREVFI
jgi:hypothetical protein